MDKGKIGIKVADGSFYPILDEGVAQRKRLVLTTVKDNQESVQIDLYKGAGEAMEEAAYIGSLLVENIAPDSQGNAEIDLVVGVDAEGNLESVAEDKQSGSKQSLSVGLQNLDESGLYEVPDFSFEEEDTELEDIFGEETEEDLSEESDFTEFNQDDLSEPDFEADFEESDELATLDDEFGQFAEEEVEAGEEDVYQPEEAAEAELGEEETEEEAEQEPRSKARPILVALLVILALGLIGALLYLFVFMAADEEAAPQLQAQQEQEQAQEQPEAAETQPQAEEPAGDGAEAQPSAGVSPGEGEAAVTPSREQVEFTGGVWYKIRWGDTLWEISSSFYDNPWLYDQIAEENEIRNPDVIYAENSIFIPKKK